MATQALGAAVGVSVAAQLLASVGNNLRVIAFAAVAIQWVAWVHAADIFRLRGYATEMYYDFVGSLTFIILTTWSFATAQTFFPRQLMMTLMVIIWAFRLGFFLFRRVLKHGKDSRFEKVKQSPATFFIYWTIQGLWVFITAFPVFLVNHERHDHPLNARDAAGFVIWFIGIAFEAVADAQKADFRDKPQNKDAWVDEGVWRLCRHPNYFGEITLWTGVFVVSTNVIHGIQWITIICPIFVYLLLRYLSGVPILEKQARKKWGDNEKWQAYMKKTPCLVPFIGPK